MEKYLYAELSDLKEILKLQYLAYQSEAKLFNDKNILPLTQTIDELIEEYKIGVILKVVNDDNRIIGSVRAKVNNNTAYIGKLMVHPDFQGKGIGKKLLYEIEKRIKASRYELFTSTRSEKNINLYKKQGYEIFKIKEISNELKFVYLEKVE